MKKVKLKIQGMHCTSCAMSIDFDLEDLGVKSSKTNYAKQETEVVFEEDKIKLPEILEQIQKTGYKPEVQK